MRPAARVVIGALWLTGCLLRTVDELEAIDEERDGPGWGPEVVAWCFREDVARRAEELGWRRVVLLDPQGVEDDVVSAILAR